MRNALDKETVDIGDGLRSVAELLPASWRLEPGASSISLIGPGGTSVTYLIEARRSGTATGLLLARLREQARQTDLPLLFLSDYLGPSLRETLTTEGISYADATGWVRITSDDPLILLTGEGAAKSPRARKSTTVFRLNGVAANRIIRVLCTEAPPLKVRALAALADVSPGSVSKLLPTLVREGIIERNERGGVVLVRRRALIQRWALDYSYSNTNGSVGYFIAPRGLDRTLSRVSSTERAVTLTGSAAARRLLPEGATSVVPLRLLAIYTDAPNMLAEELGLIPADPVAANTVLAVPQDGKVLADLVAPVALVLADLLTLPGRGEAEAEQLMDVLARASTAWNA